MTRHTSLSFEKDSYTRYLVQNYFTPLGQLVKALVLHLLSPRFPGECVLMYNQVIGATRSDSEQTEHIVGEGKADLPERGVGCAVEKLFPLYLASAFPV